MSNTSDCPPEGDSSNTTQTLRLGRREFIRLLGLYHAKNCDKQLTAAFYDGLLFPDGRKHTVFRRLAATTKREALPIAESILEELEAQWDKFASVIAGHAQVSGFVYYSVTERSSMQSALNHALTKLSKTPRSPSCLAQYQTASRYLLRYCGTLAEKAPCDYSEADCAGIRDAILCNHDLCTATAQQLMACLRGVLRHVEGFPAGLIDQFRVPRQMLVLRVAPSPFLPSEREAILDNLQHTDRTTRGLVLLMANGALPLGEAAGCKKSQLQKARVRWTSLKRGTSTEFVLWDITKSCLKEAGDGPDTIYVFPELLFTAKEQLKDPNINRRPLAEEELARRQERARWKATSLVNHYLRQVCKIAREGVSHRSFRLTEPSAGMQDLGSCRRGERESHPLAACRNTPPEV